MIKYCFGGTEYFLIFDIKNDFFDKTWSRSRLETHNPEKPQHQNQR
jgi:hypothetical protein